MAQQGALQEKSPVETFFDNIVAAKSEVNKLLEQPRIDTVFDITDKLNKIMFLSSHLEELPQHSWKWYTLNLFCLYAKMKLVDVGTSPVAEFFPKFYGDMFLQCLGILSKGALACIVRVISEDNGILGADVMQREGNIPLVCSIAAAHLYYEETDVDGSKLALRRLLHAFEPRLSISFELVLQLMSRNEIYEEARLNLLRLRDDEAKMLSGKAVSAPASLEGMVGIQSNESLLQFFEQTATLMASIEPSPVSHEVVAISYKKDQGMLMEPLVSRAASPCLISNPKILSAVPASEPLRRSIRIQKRKLQLESTPKEAAIVSHSSAKTPRTSSGPPRKTARYHEPEHSARSSLNVPTAPRRRKALLRHDKYVVAVQRSESSHLREENVATAPTMEASAANVQEASGAVETSAGVSSKETGPQPRRPLHRQSHRARATRESAPSVKGRRSRPAEVGATVPAPASNLPPSGHSCQLLPLSNVLPAIPAEFTPAKVTKRVTAARRTQRQAQGVPYDKRRRATKKLTVAFDWAQLCTSRQVDTQPEEPPPIVQPMESEVSKRARREPRSSDGSSAGTQTHSSQRKQKASSGKRNGPSPASRAEEPQHCSKRPKLARKPKKEKLVTKVIDPCQLRLLAQQYAVQPNHTGLRRSKRQTAVFATEFIRHCVTKPSGTWQDWATWEDFKIKDLYSPPVLRKLKANDQTAVTPRRSVRASRIRIR